MSAFYEQNQATAATGAWPAPGRQSSWEQPAPPSRSGTASASRDESAAFSSQFEGASKKEMAVQQEANALEHEIERATDNLVKSGKWMAGGAPQYNSRRESMPPMMMGRGFNNAEYGPGQTRHHSVSEYDGMRSNSAAGLQGYYASQRFAPRQNEAEQMMQAKRRMAAQRERELRNYHQEQQYNRNTSAQGPKPDRALSPAAAATTMSEDERRDLIARQHRALYGNESALYPTPEAAAAAAAAVRRASQDVRGSISGDVRASISGASRGGASPLAFDPFHGEPAVQMPPRDGVMLPKSPNSASSPQSNPTTFGSLLGLQGCRGGTHRHSSRIQRCAGYWSEQAFGFSANEQARNERSTSAGPNGSVADKGVSLGSWGSNSGVWGSAKNSLGVQAPVWG
ncbi:unnamed protein product [Aureobasidium pullulans]|nr:unnamed protein product [Aureobasidium pullulans]